MNVIDRIMARAQGKSALYDRHPELEDRIHIMSMSSEEQTALYGSDFRVNAENYIRHMWLQKAIRVLRDNISVLPLRVAKGSRANTEYLDNHRAYQLFDNPNPQMSPEDFWGQWITDMMIGGEWGVEVSNSKAGSVAELWPRQPDIFNVQVESKRYQKIGGYKIDDHTGKPYTLPPTEFIHFKFYNPLEPFRGLSPATAVRLSIDIDQLSQAWSKLFFKNSARPDFAIIAPQGITQSEKAEMMKKLNADHGQTHAHEPIILESGVTDIKTFSFPAKDIEWMTQREMSRDEVAAIVGVPDELMGYGKDTYENFGTAMEVLWKVTIVPLTEFRDGVLTRFCRLIKIIAPNERIATDLRDVSELQDDKTAKITQAQILFNMGVSLNDASEFLNLGLKKVPGGDVGYLNSSYVPVDQLPVIGGGMLLSMRGGVQKETSDYGSETHAAIYKRLQSRIDVHVSDLQRIAKREFQRQQNEILQRLRDGKNWGRGKYKADEDVPQPNDLFYLEAEIKSWSEAMKKKITQAIQAIGQSELAGLGLSTIFDISRPDVVRRISYILETVARKTNETTWNDLIQIMREAEQAGEGIVAIQERLNQYFGERKSDYQTERIARTTMTGASNSGQQQAWNQAEQDGVTLNKRWISALQPDRTRPEHAEAHNQVVGLHDLFLVGGENLEYPGDPTGSPGNIINCLCGMIAEVVE
jgi:HK97 family phage portal protein